MNIKFYSPAFKLWLSETCGITFNSFCSIVESVQNQLYEAYISCDNDLDIVRFIKNNHTQLNTDFVCYLNRHNLSQATFFQLDIKTKINIYNNYYRGLNHAF